jgi:flagellar hook-associated protein 2
MGRLSSSIGLITGTNIVGTVDQLIAISAQARDRLVARTETLQEQQSAIAELTALVIGVQLAGGRLNQPAQFQARSATSSNKDALSVVASSSAQLGTFTAHTLQLAATHSAQSNFRTADPKAALGLSGEILIRGGGFLTGSAALADLNQGRGVQAGSIRISDRAGNTAEVDLSAATDIDQVIKAINNTAGIRIQATTVGDSIRLTDTSGSTAFNLRVDEVGGGETAADLGLRGIDVAASVATGHDIYGDIGDPIAKGLQGVSLAKLGGGSGLGTLGAISVTTSNGANGSIDLSTAQTTQDILRLINDSGLAIEARLNDAGSGFRIRDLSGGNQNDFAISSADDTATKLGIAAAVGQRVIEGNDLGRQFVDADTPLSKLRQGRGITGGFISITDSRGATAAIDLTDAADISVGNLISRINASGLSLVASLSSTGDGINITDTGGGSGSLRIADTAGTKTAAELGLTGSAESFTDAGITKQRLVSAERQSVTITAGDSLEDIVARINESSRMATASLVQSSDGQYAIAFRSARGGDVGRLAITSTGAGLGISTTATGQDAVVKVTSEQGGVQQIRSIDGVFKDAVPGVTLTAKSLTETPVSINVDRDTATATSNVKAFVTQYNKLADKLKSLTFYDGGRNAAGLLFGSSEALRIESTYSKLLSGMVFGAGDIRSIGELGLSFDTGGQLQFNETRFADKLGANSQAVQTFLTQEKTGLVSRLNDASDRLAGINNSLLLSRSEALGERILRNNQQANVMQVRLDAERERLLKQFISAEEAIGKLQSNQNAISQIQMIRMPSRDR